MNPSGNLIVVSAAAAAVIALASCSSQRPPFKDADSITIRLKPGFETDYAIHRVWKATPKQTGNGNQIHDLKVQVLEAKAPPRDALQIRVSEFKGVDLAHQETKHLADMAPLIAKQWNIRPFDGDGVKGPWNYEGAPVNTGWAGMMVDKAIGCFEIGFLELHYPGRPVEIGEEWTANLRIGDEAVRAIDCTLTQGGTVQCAYGLESVDRKANTANISFHCAGTVKARRQLPGYPRVDWATEDVVQSGQWVIDLSRGMPISFHADRTQKLNFDGRESVESSVTDVRALKVTRPVVTNWRPGTPAKAI